MEDSRKTDNVVKIFSDSLRESKEYSDTIVETISRSIVAALVQLHDPTKKEFREKVNTLKMKLKGSRNSSIRKALLTSTISPSTFVDLPNEKLTPEYFETLSKESTDQSTQSTTTASTV